MKKKIFTWAFVAPTSSPIDRPVYSGVMSFLCSHPEIILNTYTIDDPSLDGIVNVDGIILFSNNLATLRAPFERAGRPLPPTIVLTQTGLQPDIDLAVAHGDADGVCERVWAYYDKRGIDTFGYIHGCHPQTAAESAALEEAFARVIEKHTGKRPAVFVPTVTRDTNVFPGDIDRFARWVRAFRRPCGLLAYTDSTAKTTLDACRIAGINVPGEVSVMGIGNVPFICDYTHPTLSSCSVDKIDVGRDMAEALYRLAFKGETAASVSFTVEPGQVVERTSTVAAPRGNRLVKRAYAEIEASVAAGRPINVPTLAHKLDVSRRKLEIHFKTATGITILDAIAEARLMRLADLLRSSKQPLSALPKRAGFASLSTAKRTFVLRFGMSMSAYRKKM